ncbi:MAG TPA: Rieske 2Fe-2S domain-containing protein [Chloroflexota bacterium]|nr:Rieske 2Fe-2S domain-containing protein [Chloroflexota bacterium]
MLSREENELLTRVGPGTPMGELMRRYWMPALLSEEVAEPDGDPVRIRLLGEDFVAFRDTSGRLGLLADACAHRCASLSYGRNEEGGLRCLYHGWKYDVQGHVLETPNEPEQSQLRHKVQQRSLPLVEASGVVWTYLADPATAPAFPTPAWAQAPETHRAVARMKLAANYLQVVEGGLDTTHVGILHQTAMASLPEHPVHKTPDLAMLKGDTTPRLETQLTSSGFQYAAIRRVDDDTRYIRLTSYVMPWYTTVPHFDSVPQQTQGYVPIDDENTWFWLWWVHDRPIDAVMLKAFQGADPRTGEFEMPGTRENHHLQDRASMRNGSWTGLRGIMAEDSAMTESMGPVVDRSKEHLGMSDAAVIRLRRLLLDTLRDVERGKEPPGVHAGLPIGRPYSVAQTCGSNERWQDYGLMAEFLD